MAPPLAVAAVRPRRSLLFVPGLRPELIAKADAAGPDLVCVDLEDAVAPDLKAQARAATFAALAQGVARRAELVVRINGLSTEAGLEDLTALLRAERPPAGIMVPKTRAAAELRLLDELVGGRSRLDALRLHVIIETCDGLADALAIARSSPRIASLLFGAVDMSADLRCENAWEPLLYARSKVVHAAAAAGVDALDVPFLDLGDEAGLAREAAASAALGFGGKAAIHPRQLGAIHAAFTPTPAQIERARRIVAAYEASETGLVVIEGRLIELPVVRSMYRLLAGAAPSGA
jgi:citrate lyase beta subunit